MSDTQQLFYGWNSLVYKYINMSELYFGHQDNKFAFSLE